MCYVYNMAVDGFIKGTQILTDNGYKLIENLRRGDLIKTIKDENKPIHVIGKKEMIHMSETARIKDQLYKYSEKENPDMFEDLIISGTHCILSNDITEDLLEKTKKLLGDKYMVYEKYRIPSNIDEKSSIYHISGIYTIYNFALENTDYYMYDGIYANGLLVDCCSKYYIKEKSQMMCVK